VLPGDLHRGDADHPRTAGGGAYDRTPMADDEQTYSDAELDAAIAALSDPERFRAAEARVTRAAPQLQRVLDDALSSSGGLLDTVQAQQIRDAAGHADPADRMAAISQLMSEEARLGMLVGVAVGWELARELAAGRVEADGPATDQPANDQ
jgi:hypothetical protein